jgi:hypothetical protein
MGEWARIISLEVAGTRESPKVSLLTTQPSAVASEDIKERHINTAPHTPEPEEDDGEDELGDDEELDEDDMVSSAVRVVLSERGWAMVMLLSMLIMLCRSR